MDTFVNSSWYYLRYCDPKNNKKIFDSKKTNYWCPIDQYIGGPEHITMHLIYFRFYAKFLRDLGLLNFDEPALRYFTQGIVHAADGEKMSKSKGNIIEPLEMINKFGADTLRLGLVSFASADKNTNWDEKIVAGSHKFLKKVFEYFSDLKFGKVDAITESKLNKAIKLLTENIESFKHNLAVIKIRQLFNSFYEKSIDKKTAESFLKMLHIYCPHVTEELWSKLGNKSFISLEKWPIADEKKIDKKFEEQEEAVEKLKTDINNIKNILGKKNPKVYVYVLPKELDIYKGIENVQVFAVNDKQKHDPENKSKKAKPDKPAIYLE
jgi:leucyl-tRNA synthetase